MIKRQGYILSNYQKLLFVDHLYNVIDTDFNIVPTSRSSPFIFKMCRICWYVEYNQLRCIDIYNIDDDFQYNHIELWLKNDIADKLLIKNDYLYEQHGDYLCKIPTTLMPALQLVIKNINLIYLLLMTHPRDVAILIAINILEVVTYSFDQYLLIE